MSENEVKQTKINHIRLATKHIFNTKKHKYILEKVQFLEIKKKYIEKTLLMIKY